MNNCRRTTTVSMQDTLAICVVLCLLLTFPQSTAALDFSYGADLRQNALLMRWPSGIDHQFFPKGSFGISGTRARVKTRVFADDFTINGALETKANFLSGDMGSTGMFGEGGGIFGTSTPLERWNLTEDHIDEESTSLSTRLERLDIRWTIRNYDIDIGRQPISLGTSHFVGVLDVIAPFAPGDMDATYKPGIDAVRIRRGIGMTGEAEVIAAAAKKWSGGALLGRYRMMYRGVDFEFVAGRFRHRGFGGVGWEGEIWETAIWGEMALFERRKDAEKWRAGWSKAAFSGVAGVDLSLPAKFKLGGSFMYQDFGARRPEDLALTANDAPFREGWAFLGSASYGVLTLHRELHPLVQGNLAGILNLVDGSTLWQPRISISTGNNTDLSLYGWFATGKKPDTSTLIPMLRSEFGQIPDGGGFYARWFF